MRTSFHSVLRKLYTEPSYQISAQLATRFREDCFRNQPISNKNCLWWPCLLTDRDEIDRRDRDRMLVGITSTYAISAYHH